MIRTLIVDDEPLARRGIRRMLESDADLTIVGECANGQEAVDAITAGGIDLVLLDVQMPLLDGFGVVAALDPANAPVIVFLTAHDEFALRAFEASALDYVVKPFSEERLARAIDRAKRSILGHRTGQASTQLATLRPPSAPPLVAPPAPSASLPVPGAPAEYVSRIVVRLSGSVRFVRVDDIDWIEGADYYARLHVGPKSYLVRETMQELEARLDPRKFVRTHRSAIANLDRVTEIKSESKGRYVVLMRDGSRIPLSRAGRAALEALFGQAL